MRLISAIDRASLAGREPDDDEEDASDEEDEDEDEEGALKDGRRASGDMARVMDGFASDENDDEEEDDEASSDDDDLLASNGLPLSVRKESLRVSVPPPPPPLAAAGALTVPLPPVFWRESIGGPPAPGGQCQMQQWAWKK